MTTNPNSSAAKNRGRATALALIATLFLFLLKTVVAILTGSVGVLSESIHSGLDVVSSIVTFFVARAAIRPADWDHPFGHGKIESLSAMFEALLLFVAAGYIVYEGISRALDRTHHLQHVGWGLAVIGFSMFLNWFVYIQNRGVGRSEESIAIETNAFHFLTDIFSSLAVFLSLGIIHITNWVFLDPMVAILIAIYIVWIAISQIRKCVAELSDTTLPSQEVTVITQVIEQHKKGFLNFHDLRTRKAGASRYVDFHLEICSDAYVAQAHAICDAIEDDLMKTFRDVHVNIHVEPCGNHGDACTDKCRFFDQPRKIKANAH